MVKCPYGQHFKGEICGLYYAVMFAFMKICCVVKVAMLVNSPHIKLLYVLNYIYEQHSNLTKQE